MKTLNVTRVIFSTIDYEWYLQINNLQEIKISEKDAQDLIKYYELSEINMNRWQLL